jgi:hypothetical protein
VGPSINNGPCSVSIGLDSMSFYSLISPSLYQRLCAIGECSLSQRNCITVHTDAGVPEKISSFVTVHVDIPVDSLSISNLYPPFSIFDIPTDILIGWSDIKKFQLLSFFL